MHFNLFSMHSISCNLFSVNNVYPFFHMATLLSLDRWRCNNLSAKKKIENQRGAYQQTHKTIVKESSSDQKQYRGCKKVTVFQFSVSPELSVYRDPGYWENYDILLHTSLEWCRCTIGRPYTCGPKQGGGPHTHWWKNKSLRLWGEPSVCTREGNCGEQPNNHDISDSKMV